MKKKCPYDKILNPETNRCVFKHTVKGKEVLRKLNACPDDRILNPETNRCVFKHTVKGKEVLKKLNAKSDNRILNPVTDKNYLKSYRCFKTGLRQISGTCWFNTIFNSLVLPDETFKIILNKYRGLSENDLKIMKSIDPASNGSCPLNVKRLYFFKNFESFLKKKQKINKDIVTNKINYPQKMVDMFQIRSTPNWHDHVQEYDPRKGLKIVLKILFDKDECMVLDYNGIMKKDLVIPKETKILILTENNHIQYKHIPQDIIPVGWKLNSTCIVMINEKEKYSHAISGYYCKNRPNIYNSNEKEIVNVDFLNHEKVLQLYPEYSAMVFNYSCFTRI